MFKKYLIVLVFLVVGKGLQAQEFNLDVKVTTPKLQKVDPKVFKTLEASLNEFINDKQWTEDVYEIKERIEGSFSLIILDELDDRNFKAEIRIQTIRPVYDSNYKSPTLNLVDGNVSFGYVEYQPLETSDKSFNDNLSSIVSYYVYMMLGYEYDTFAPLGGEEFYTLAQNVISVLPTALGTGDVGWDLRSKNNRYTLLENALSPRIKELRYSIYDYHINGLDRMYEDPERAKAVIVSTITALQTANKKYPFSTYVQTFTDTKREEIVEIFKDANRGQQDKVIDIMSEVNPYSISLYEQINKR